MPLSETNSLSDVVEVVAYDSHPALVVQFKDNIADTFYDVSNRDWTVKARFRVHGDTGDALFTQTCAKLDSGANGVVRMEWPSGGLDVDAGMYELEFFIERGSATELQTAVRRLLVRVLEPMES